MIRALPILGLAGCLAQLDASLPTLEIDCGGDSAERLSGAVTSAPSLPVDVVARVQGTARHADGLAIHRVLVGGQLAERTGFNWETWEADLSWAFLSGLPHSADTVTVDVVAVDTCGVAALVDEVGILLDPTPDVEVRDLSLDASISGGRDFLPATSTATAQLTITANPEAAGAEVVLDASLGEILGGSVLTLSGNGVSSARATVLFASDDPGTALISAVAEGVVATTTVVVAAPPALLPAALDLGPGDFAAITVFSDGDIDRCAADDVYGLTAESGGVDITVTPYAADSTGDGRPDVFVEATEFLFEPVLMRVECVDTWGQVGGAAVIGQP